VAKEIKAPKLALRLQQKLRETDSNPRRLSQKLGMAYDHVRKIYNGDVFPGPNALRNICDQLGLDYEEMDRLVKADRAIDKGWVHATTGKDAVWSKVEAYWKLLSDSDKAEILTLVQMKSERQQGRKSRRSA
jgi:hypothetical protein